MAIILPRDLPATQRLKNEGVEVIVPDGRKPSDSGVLRILLLNLMPTKAATEYQIARVLGRTDRTVELTLSVPDSYRSRSVPAQHMAAFYKPWVSLRSLDYDGLIVTGAPVETLPFEAVDYWQELTEILDWARETVPRSLYICWAAQAALYHYHGVPKRLLNGKLFGLFSHRIRTPGNPLLRGLERRFCVPVSRHTEVHRSDLPLCAGLDVLADSPETGLCMIEDRRSSALYMFNHLEYETDSLKREYLRDRAIRSVIQLPRNYFPNNNLSHTPLNSWQHSADRFFANWIEAVARSTKARLFGNRMLNWLESDRPRLSLVSRPYAEFLVDGMADLPVLPDLLRRLSSQGLSPSSARRPVVDQDRVMIELRVEAVDSQRTQRIAAQLLKTGGVVQVGYRASRGTAGVLWNRAPEATAHVSVPETASCEFA